MVTRSAEKSTTNRSRPIKSVGWITSFTMLGITAYHDLTEQSSVQAGVNVNWAPELYGEVELAGAMDPVMFDTRSLIGGADITYKWTDPSGRKSHTVGIEGFASRHETPDEEAAALIMTQQRAHGYYGYWEHALSPQWAVGFLGGHYELREARKPRSRRTECDRDLQSFTFFIVGVFSTVSTILNVAILQILLVKTFMSLWCSGRSCLVRHAHGLDW